MSADFWANFSHLSGACRDKTKFRPMRAQQSPRNRKMAAISHGVCAWLHFWCCIYYLFSFVFFKYPYTCTCSANTTCSMSFNPVLFAELLRKYDWNVQSNNVIRQARTTGSVRGSGKGDEDERNKNKIIMIEFKLN